MLQIIRTRPVVTAVIMIAVFAQSSFTPARAQSNTQQKIGNPNQGAQLPPGPPIKGTQKNPIILQNQQRPPGPPNKGANSGIILQNQQNQQDRGAIILQNQGATGAPKTGN